MSAILKDPLLRFRPMRTEDVDALYAIETQAYGYPWSIGIFHDCLRVGYCCWVCEIDQELIGYGVMSVAVGEAHILNLCVHPDWQSQGLGRRILGRMLNLARERHADTAFLEVRASNRPAQALYDSEGFNEIGQRCGYYPADEGREDALVYAKSL